MRIIIGGTFDHLHKGHLELIRKAFQVGNYVYIGLTTDRYVKKMKPGRKIARYSTRKKALTGAIKRFNKKFEILPLDDKFGPSTTGNFDAIVVSEETFHVAVEINKIRKKKKIHTLSIIKVPYALAKDRRPISTSRILRKEIDREGNLIRKK